MYPLVLLVAVLTTCAADHFRGGTISWKSIGGYEVEFHFKMGWTYGDGPGCIQAKIGQYVNNTVRGYSDWRCTQGCPGSTKLHSTDYICVGASVQDNYEEGQMSFKHNFPNVGPFVVTFEGRAWMKLGMSKGDGDWRIATMVDLRTRNDTGRPNSSPVTSGQAIYYMQYDCHHELKIPVLDPDGDKLLCQWAKGNECMSVCNGLPGAILDEETCTISFDSTAVKNYMINEFYGVAITIRDYPKNAISLGNQGSQEIKSTKNSLSEIPLQFLIKTPVFPVGCDVKPRFVNPTPAEGSTLTYRVGMPIDLNLVADNNIDYAKGIVSIDVVGPVQLKQTPLMNDTTRNNTFFKTVTWKPSQKEIGEYIICAKAVNERRKTSDPRCFTVKIVDNCFMDPCRNGGVCYSVGNDYICDCVLGYTDKNCTTDINECVSNPCLHGGNCTDQVNDFVCSCPPGFTGKNCHIGMDFCQTKPCKNGGICSNNFDGFKCHCVDGWQGKVCDYRPTKARGSSCIKSLTANHKDHSQISNQNACCQAMEYSNCECFISPYMPPEEIEGMEQNMRDLFSALIGFPLGLGLSLLTYAIFWCCVSRTETYDAFQKFKSRHSPSKRCFNRTEKWIEDPLAPVGSTHKNKNLSPLKF